jgi:hypothetical protein
MISIVEVIVDENAGIVVPAERAPTAVVMAPIPMHPGRAPGMMGNPVPAKAEPPTPAAVVVNGPAPRLGGDPGPAAQRIPVPVPIVIRSPIHIGVDIGHPDMAVRPLVGPITVVGQLAFIVVELGGQISFGDVAGLDGVPVFVPNVKIIPSLGEARLRA